MRGTATVEPLPVVRPATAHLAAMLATPSGPGWRRVTAQGSPRTVFKRAIEHKSLTVAEMTAREMGAVTLDEALALVVLVAELRPERLDAFARRWFARLAEEKSLTLAELDLAVTALRALPSTRAAAALAQLLK
jgi:hypothetical protein